MCHSLTRSPIELSWTAKKEMIASGGGGGQCLMRTGISFSIFSMWPDEKMGRGGGGF